MTRYIDISRDRQISTNYNPRYSITRMIPIEEIEYENGFIEINPDLLNWSLCSMMNQIDKWKPFQYDGTLPITTISYKVYKTTTLWWLIMMYNGYIHPLEIEQGVLLKIPDISQVDAFLNKMERNRRGTISKAIEI